MFFRKSKLEKAVDNNLDKCNSIEDIMNILSSMEKELSNDPNRPKNDKKLKKQLKESRKIRKEIKNATSGECEQPGEGKNKDSQ